MKTRTVLRRALAVLMASSLVFVFAACNKKTDGGGTSASKTIKFAAVAPMTGDGAVMGQQQKWGVQIAVDELNAAGGVLGNQLAFDVFDDQGSPNQALIAAQKIVGDKDIRFVIGHINSGCSLAALPTYQQANLPEISSTNTNPQLTSKGFKNYFRVILDDNAFMGQDTQFAVKELGFSKIGVMYENTDFGTGGRDVVLAELQKLGLKSLSTVTYNPSTDRDFSAQITGFKSAGVECVIFVGEYTAASIYLKQRASLGLTAAIVGCSSEFNPEILKIAGKDAEGLYTVSSFNPNNTDTMMVSFVKKFKELSGGTQPGEWSAHGYDAVLAAVNGIKTVNKADFTGQELIDALHSMPEFQGVTGKIKFDEKGDVTGKILSYWHVENGQFASYTPTKLG
ncbi:MAG: ABC transporter substrate-binding protein [Clostridiales bacterium]|nr:ABC transporter substrate-binding protein [Clostridiales bacterium]